ncbi:MAG: DivIVA domain-containing protein [Actinomycetes bacterium]
MPLFLLLLAIALVGAVWAVAVGRIGGGLDAPATTRPYRPLPQGPLVPGDVDRVRFTLGLRGYRMDEVDSVLDRLAAALEERDDEIRDLHRRLDEHRSAERRGTEEQSGSSTSQPRAEGATE